MIPPRHIPVAVGIWPNRLVLGRGAMDMLPKLLAGLGASRAFVVCGKTVSAGPLLKRVLAVLGERCAGVFNEVSAHTPLPMVERALAAMRAARADAIISVGGGSAIDAGKGLALLGMAAGPLDLYRVRYGSEGELAQERLPRSGVPHIAIPTTSGSASEVMPTSAIRDIVQLKKLLFWDDALIPQAVILDPEMAIHTGAFLSASGGMTAVARCVESLYSASRNPVTDGLALHALRLLYRNLPIVIDRPDDLDARFACQIACAMSGIAAINSMVSIVHALGHIVGGKYGLQHGVSHAILLAPAMRQMLPVIGDTQHLVLDALGGGLAATADEAGLAAADRVQALVGRLPLSSKLRELGIGADEIGDIAAQGSQDYMMANLPRPMSVPDIEALLRKAW